MSSDPFDLAGLETASETTASSPPPAPYLEMLNSAQRAAVEALDGPVLVLAGAGTGKTRVLTSRLGHLIFTRRAYPSQLLAVTFTNKAAREMKERVAHIIGGAVEGLWLGTFHSVAARMLRRHAELVGLKPNFTIIDTDDQLRLLKQLIQAEHIDEKRWPARALAAVINRWKDKGLLPPQVLGEDQGNGYADGKGPKLYAAYQDRLRTLNACDFGDLLLHLLDIFKREPEVLSEWQRRFRYILVDEYQDTNVSQYLWLRLLAQRHRNICCVGDDDQSIYAWRGAEVGNILRFERDFEGAKIIRLEQNYRSTPHILGCASGLITKNESRLGKTLWTEINDGEKVAIRGVWDGAEEARWIGDEVEASQRKGFSLSETAILVRAGFQTREFEERFLTLGIPYRVIGGLRFYERQEIRDALAYLRIIHQPDDDLAFERIFNVPKRGLGDATLQTLHRIARDRGCSLLNASRLAADTEELKPKPRSTLRKLVEDFDRWRAMIDILPHTELTETMLDESGYTAMWQADRSAEAPGRLENLKELVRAMESFENLGGFLEHVALVMDAAENENSDMVSLMTLHAAKGLEFDVVFLPGWEEGLFPHPRALDENGLAGLEEERRLAYVGITRAKRVCRISFAANRRIYNQWQATLPSRFVEELPSEHVDQLSDTGVWGSGNMGEMGSTITNNNFTYNTSWPVAKRTLEITSHEIDEGNERNLRQGQRVFHQKFGYGHILHVDGDKLEIAFDKAGRKKVLSSFIAIAQT